MPKPQPQLYDSITRNCITSRIRRLAKMYNLHWLVEQGTFNTPGLDTLEDGDLSTLLQQMERARECIAEGIGFDDACLLIDASQRLHPPMEDC